MINWQYFINLLVTKRLITRFSESFLFNFLMGSEGMFNISTIPNGFTFQDVYRMENEINSEIVVKMKF